MKEASADTLRRIAEMEGVALAEKDAEEVASELNAVLHGLREFENEDLQDFEPATKFVWEPVKRK
ncbi:MAG: hypothetical protein HYU39_01485 [Thaumarchaeota archaeon]|nr:hypothetical protein [Nitrososphaerota archaeon]